MSERPFYVIGDLQGCYESFEELLALLPSDADLLFVGDLINRGPDSLGTLRRVMALGDRANTVLGNHDLHLLAVAAGVRYIERTRFSPSLMPKMPTISTIGYAHALS